MLKEGYIPKEQRKTILLLSDDIRMSSGISTMAREIVIGTSHHFNWINLGSAINHPEQGKRLDLSEDTNKHAGIEDSSVVLYPYNGYGDSNIIRNLLKFEKIDALMFFTDPRYFIWLFQIEDEIRKKIPMIYLNIWDDLPYPMYNKHFYESCDALFAISKQTENINKVVLGEKSKDKIIKYVPHGINEDVFYPIDSNNPKYFEFLNFKNKFLNNKEYDFTLVWNSRNIMRKNVSTILLGWKIFIDSLSDEQAKKCALILHTQPIDDNGTDLFAVSEMLFGKKEKYNIIFSDQRRTPEEMNYIYNLSDACILISSNEGWGLSITEAMMCGKPIIGNVTGGIQDQMRFENEDGNWIEFNESFGSNHRGKYKKCGKWAFPIFPSNISLIGSVPTPYIYDDRVNFDDVAQSIKDIYNCGKEYREFIGKEARKWVTSDESMMSSRWMCKNIINGIEETFQNWKPRPKYELLKIEYPTKPKHFVKYPIAI